VSVNWQDWKEDAFKQAQSQNKLILLSIGATWCHWCHRMDSDTYDVEEIANKINSHFIPIRVDTDRRPDINDRYNMGGWPTTAILTPKGDLVAGATYIPPNQMTKFLDDVKNEYEKKGDSIKKHVAETSGKRDKENLEDSILKQFEEMIEYYFDSVYSGFGSSMKFPQTDLLSFLATMSECRNKKSTHMLEATLEAMGKRGMYDHEEGGFFRYTTQQNWEVPHYEKMLEDNIRIIDVYLRVYKLTENDWYKEKATHALSYVMKNLYDPESKCFFGSQDADEKYYKKNINQRSSENAPSIDNTIYVNWNCFCVVTLLHASEVIDITYKKKALSTPESIFGSHV